MLTYIYNIFSVQILISLRSDSPQKYADLSVCLLSFLCNCPSFGSLEADVRINFALHSARISAMELDLQSFF